MQHDVKIIRRRLPGKQARFVGLAVDRNGTAWIEYGDLAAILPRTDLTRFIPARSVMSIAGRRFVSVATVAAAAPMLEEHGERDTARAVATITVWAHSEIGGVAA